MEEERRGGEVVARLWRGSGRGAAVLVVVGATGAHRGGGVLLEEAQLRHRARVDRRAAAAAAAEAQLGVDKGEGRAAARPVLRRLTQPKVDDALLPRGEGGRRGGPAAERGELPPLRDARDLREPQPRPLGRPLGRVAAHVQAEHVAARLRSHPFLSRRLPPPV